jgi:hypothetical protein
MCVGFGVEALALACALAANAPQTHKEPVIVLHKSCGVGTQGKPYAEGICEFTARPGYAVVAGGISFAWKAYHEPLGGCAGKVVFGPPAVEPHRVVVHAHAEQNDGRDCGGVMVYHIETVPEPGAGPEGPSAGAGERRDPD